MASETERAMRRQPAELERLVRDAAPVEAAAARIRGRRTFLAGTGTSWHAAEQGAALLRLAGIEAWPVQAFDMALEGPRPGPGDALVLLSHRGTKRYTSEALARARRDGVATVVIGGIGSPGADVETVEPERSSTFTASHLGALTRLAGIAQALGARLGDLSAVPGAVARALDEERPAFEPPARAVDFIGAGINAWTAFEGALKARETSRVFCAGWSVEQFLHGPAVAIGDGDALVALDGGGPGAERVRAVGDAAARSGARVHELQADDLGEPLSIFPLTAAVQRIALELALAVGSDPDAFGFDVPGREEAWGSIVL